MDYLTNSKNVQLLYNRTSILYFLPSYADAKYQSFCFLWLFLGYFLMTLFHVLKALFWLFCGFSYSFQSDKYNIVISMFLVNVFFLNIWTKFARNPLGIHQISRENLDFQVFNVGYVSDLLGYQMDIPCWGLKPDNVAKSDISRKAVFYSFLSKAILKSGE